MIMPDKQQKPDQPSARQATALDIHIGRMIRERRNAMHLTQDRMAKLLMITQRQLHKYETGENRVSASRLSEVAQVLRVPVAVFFGEQAATSRNAQRQPDQNAQEAELLAHFRQLTDGARAQLVSLANVLRMSTAGQRK
jgi:transcriptional regulator with XRE-family HTH domain